MDWVVTDLALLRWDDTASRFDLIEVALGFDAGEMMALTEKAVLIAPSVGSMDGLTRRGIPDWMQMLFA